MFGAPKSRAQPEPDEDPPPPPPDYPALVERQLRIADAERWARKMWSEILEDYRADSERQEYL